MRLGSAVTPIPVAGVKLTLQLPVTPSHIAYRMAVVLLVELVRITFITPFSSV